MKENTFKKAVVARKNKVKELEEALVAEKHNRKELYREIVKEYAPVCVGDVCILTNKNLGRLGLPETEKVKIFDVIRCFTSTKYPISISYYPYDEEVKPGYSNVSRIRIDENDKNVFFEKVI